MTRFLIFIQIICFNFSNSQVSGNVAYSYSRNYNSNQNETNNAPILYLNDSSFIIESKILKNVKPDFYIAVFSINASKYNINSCLNDLNVRTKSFIENLKKNGVELNDIETDFLTQVKEYDINKEGNEYLKGFNNSKSIRIKIYKIKSD